MSNFSDSEIQRQREFNKLQMYAAKDFSDIHFIFSAQCTISLTIFDELT